MYTHQLEHFWKNSRRQISLTRTRKVHVLPYTGLIKYRLSGKRKANV